MSKWRNRCRSALSLIGWVALIGLTDCMTAGQPQAGVSGGAATHEVGDQAKRRIFVLTDIGSDPDDEESLVRFLLYTNEFDVEGMAATTSTWLRDEVHPELIEERVRAYGQVLPNLQKQAAGYPAENDLLARIVSGAPLYGMLGVGAGRDSSASDLLIAAIDRPDPRPVWVTDWGGANVLAQALWKVHATRTAAAVDAFIAKLRVYAISDQDDAGPWIRRNFPALIWISSIHAFNQYFLATWGGISGEHFFHTEVGADFTTVSHEWLASNIRKGPLGGLYPDWKYIMEGDTPSFLFLIPNGLGVLEHPEYGGWGGRYGKLDAEDGLYADMIDKVIGVDGKLYVGNQATIWRWRDAFQNDFAARIGWTLTPSFQQANHNPILVVNGSDGRLAVEISAAAGTEVRLDATGSYDPDHDRIAYRWWQYNEPSIPPFDKVVPPILQIRGENAIQASFSVPPVKQMTAFHVILEAHDAAAHQLSTDHRNRRSVNALIGAARRWASFCDYLCNRLYPAVARRVSY